MKAIEYFLLRIPSLLDDEAKAEEDGKELDLPLNKSAMLAVSGIILYNYILLYFI
jgi:hypothetical protein